MITDLYVKVLSAISLDSVIYSILKYQNHYDSNKDNPGLYIFW
jgi:hypothetical protein